MRRLARKKKVSIYSEIPSTDLEYLIETAKKYLFSFDINEISEEEAAFVIACLKTPEVKHICPKINITFGDVGEKTDVSIVTEKITKELSNAVSKSLHNI